MARRKVIEWLIHRLEHEVDDDHFRMDMWLVRRSDGEGIHYHSERSIPFCKTAGCIAGSLFLGLPKAIRKAYTKIPDTWNTYNDPAANVALAAQEQLGLNGSEGDRLFAPSINDMQSIKRKHAVAVLNRMLTHSEINWKEAAPDLHWSAWGHHQMTIVLTDD